MRLWGDIYDAQDLRVGVGPVWALTTATITRQIDGIGSVTVSAPGTEARAVDLLQNERRIHVQGLQSGGAEGKPIKRSLGRGILRDIKAKASSSGWTLNADGPDSLDELQRRSVLLARVYSGQTIGQIVTDLAGLAGWSVSLDSAYASKQLQCRFDGVSVLKALQSIAEGQGLHLRAGTATRTLEMGAFGQDTGLRIVNAAYAPAQIYASDDVLLIETLTVERNSEQVINWLLPIGGGQGESAITLEHCTRVGPYPVRTITLSGKTHYYIADDDSIALYGQIEKVGSFRDINAISNSDADLEAAANALYDAAVEYLKRSKERIDTYRVSVKKVQRTIRPGDKVRLTYKGFVTNERGVIVNYANVNADVWVMKATERIGLEGLSLDLELTSIDRMAKDAVQIVIGAIESIQVQPLRVQPYPGGGTFVYGYALDASHSVTIPIEITNGVLYLNQCRLFIKSTPFRVLAKAASASEVVTSAGGALVTSTAGGGDHRHKVASSGGTSNSVNGEQIEVFVFPTNPDASATTTLAMITRGPGGGGDLYTEASSGAHTHSFSLPNHTHTVPAILIDFGIEDDDRLPDTVSIRIDGIDATAALGGPWGAGHGALNESGEATGVAFETVVDITSYLVNAPGGLRKRHEVEFVCAGGQGWIETTVELRTTIQSIAVT